jgi:hypothetical protein
MLDVSGDCLSCMPFGFPVPKYLLLDFPIFWLWTYLMNAIQETRPAY